jgi:hypothetical protein
MEPPRNNGTLTYPLVVGISVLWILYQTAIPSLVASQVPTAHGTIVSVSSTDSGKEAIVQLSDGETVRADIPAGCVVFAGQVAELASWGSHWGKNQYTILSAKEPQ